MEMVENWFVTIKRYVDGQPLESDFELDSSCLRLAVESGSDDVIVRNLYLSIDSYQINRFKEFSPSQKVTDALRRIEPGERIPAYGVGRVVASGNEEFKKDDPVVGMLGWEDYTVVRSGTLLKKIGTTEFPLSYHLGILGTSGFTAYAGFFDVCKPKAGEKVFVSAAFGSVGILVSQFAKISGCYVVGCAGSKEKVDMLKEEHWFDDAFNYKEEIDLKATLKRYFPDGIDIYFDNVGAEMLEAAVANMNNFGRVAACGVISEYTDGRKRAAPDMINIIYRRITIRGFLWWDYFHIYDEFMEKTIDHLRHRRVIVFEDISYSLESVPSAFVGLFRGDNVGKKLVQLFDL